MWKKRVVITDLVISIILILFMFLNTTQIEVIGNSAKNELLAVKNDYNFDISVKPEYSKVKAGEKVKLKLRVTNINMGENGLNNIVGYIRYNEELFDEVTIKPVGDSWYFEQNNDKSHERFGKFVAYTMDEGITDSEEILEMTLKLNSDLKPQKTEVIFSDLKSSDGKVSVDEEDRKVIIEIYEDEAVIEEPEEPKKEEPKKESIPEISAQTGDNYRFVVMLLLATMIVYSIEEIIRNRAKESKGKAVKTGVISLSILILMGMLVLGATSFAHTPEIEELINRLSKKETFLNSEDYLVTDENVLRIAPNTNVEDILDKFNKEIEITNDDEEQTITTGIISTGMKITDVEDETKYTVGVVGDLNGDGESDHIELTQIIRENVCPDKWIEDSTQRIVADISFDREINKEDIDVSVKYILYGELKIPEFEEVEAPTIEVVEGTFNNVIDAYEDTIKVKISNEDENAVRTMYKIEGAQEKAYTEIENNGIIELEENGVYKISAYSYGKEGNRSEITYDILIKKNPMNSYKVITRIENEDYTYTETIKEYEERIGTEVSISGELIGYTVDLEKSNLTGTVEENRVIELIIYYKLNRYTITYNYNGGTVATENPTEYTIVSAPITLNNPSRVGYNFQGWEGTGLSTATESVTIPTGSVGNREYTAIWTPVEYDIGYNLAGGALAEGTTNPTKYTIESNPITLNNPSRVGYNFQGWEGTDLSTVTESVTIPTGSVGNREYTAIWTPIEYSITYHLEGGTLEEGVTNPTKYTIETNGIELNNPTKENFEFLGWTGTYLEEVTNFVSIPKGSMGDREYTAVYEEISLVPVVRIVGVPDGYEENLLGEEYNSLKAALVAADVAAQAGNVKILVIGDISNESNVIKENRNFTINLGNHTVGNSKDTPAITINNGANLTILNEDWEWQSAREGEEYGQLVREDEMQNGTGTILSNNSVAIYIDEQGTLTLGRKGNSIIPNISSPKIEGKQYGIYKNKNNENKEGTFNFYDGKVVGNKSDSNEYNAYYLTKVDDTPAGYNSHVTVGENQKTAVLSTFSPNEARIELNGQEYTKLEYAIAAANDVVGNSNTPIRITLLKDIIKDAEDDSSDPNKPKELIVNSSKNIILDLNGHTLSRSNNDYVLKNYGKLEVIDSCEEVDETTGEIIAKGKITSSVNTAILNGYNNDETIIYDETIDLANVVANDDNYYFIPNGEGGIVSNNGKNVNTTGGIANSTARSYVELDLTNKQGIYEIVVDTEISSQEDSDFGYITVSPNSYTVDRDVTDGRRCYISGTQSQEVKFNVIGGRKYYIHLGYYKNAYTDKNNDCFTINNIKAGRRKEAGELTITSGTIEMTKAGTNGYEGCTSAIENEAILHINGGKIDVTRNLYNTVGINNGKTTGTGYMSVSGGSIDAYNSAIKNADLGVIDVLGGNINSSQNSGINNYGTLSVTGAETSIGGLYGIHNMGRGIVDIEGGNVHARTDGLLNDVPDGRYESVVVKGGNFSVNKAYNAINSAIYNRNSGKMRIINANVTNGDAGVYITDKGTVIIDNITITSKDSNDKPTVENAIYYNGSAESTFVQINNANVVTSDSAICIRSSSKNGTIELNGGRFESTEESAIELNGSSDENNITFIVNGGTYIGEKFGIYNGGYFTATVLGGNVEGKIDGIRVATNSTVIIGENTEDTPSTTVPVIKGTQSAVRNRVGTLKFYDGVLIGPKNNVIDGILTEKAESYELTRTIQDGLQHVTLGRGNYVARIAVSDNPNVASLNSNYYILDNGYYKFKTLKSAIMASSSSNETTIELLDDEWVCEKIEVAESQNITINLKDYKLYLYAQENFENNGTLKIKSNEGNIEEANILANAGTIMKNNTTGIVNISNVYIDYITDAGNNNDTINRKIFHNYGRLSMDNVTYNVNVDDNNKEVNAYQIYNEEGGVINVENSTLSGRVTNSIESVSANPDNSTNAVTIENTKFSMSYYQTKNNPVINSGTGTVLLESCIFEKINSGANINKSSGKMIINNTKKPTDDSAYVPDTINEASGEVEINGSYTSSITNKSEGKITINGESEGRVITNSNSNGTVIVNNGVFSAISNKGKFDIYGGIFTGSTSEYISGRREPACVFNLGSANMTISGANTAIKSSYMAIWNTSGATLQIKGGLVHTTNSEYGIRNYGLLIVGEEGGTVSTEVPKIMNTTTSSGTRYGIKNETGGQFYFYDGIIGGKITNTLNQTGSIGGIVSGTEPTYLIRKYTNGYTFTNGDLNGEELKEYTVQEYAILEQALVAQVESTGERYFSLSEAFANTANTDTITVLADITLTSNDVDAINIASGKNITLDISGYNITASRNNAFENNGTFVIKDSGREDDEGIMVSGTIKSGSNAILKNNSGATARIDSGKFSLTVDASKSNPYSCIENSGTLEVNSGTFEVSGRYHRAISNMTGGKTTINGGTFNVTGANSVAIVNEGEGAESSVITINEANSSVQTLIKGEVVNKSTGSINITGGTISKKVQNDAGGNINISGATIDNEAGNAIYNNAEGTINITSGEIRGQGTSINNNGAGTINIDGTGLTEDTPINISAYIDYSTQAIYNKADGEINVKGHVNIKTENASGDKSYYKVGIYNNGSGTISVGDSSNVTNDVKITAMSYGIVNDSGTLNYNGGTITSNLPDGDRERIPVKGYISSVPNGKDILVSRDNSQYKYEIGTGSDIAQVGSNKYNTLEGAVSANNSGTIVLLKDIVLAKTEEVEIPEGKNFVLDLNGHTINVHNKGNVINNKGTLKVDDNSAGESGLIFGYAGEVIHNEGNFEMMGGNINIYQRNQDKIINNTATGTITISGGNLTSRCAEERSNVAIVYSDNSNIINMSAGNLYEYSAYRSTVYGIWAIGDGVVINVTGGNFERCGNSGDDYFSCDIYTTNNATINVSGNATFGNDKTVSTGIRCEKASSAESVNAVVNVSGNANINNKSCGIQFKSYASGEVNVSGGTVRKIDVSGGRNVKIELTGGEILSPSNGASAIDASSTTEVYVKNNAKITATGDTNRAISGGKKIDIQGGEIVGGISSSVEASQINVSGGTITANKTALGVQGKNATSTISGGTITSQDGVGLEISYYGNAPTVTVTGGEIVSVNKSGIQIVNGTLTLGEIVNQYEVPNSTTPLVKGGTYGVENKGGTFNFYDGEIRGKTDVKSGIITDTPASGEVSGVEMKYSVIVNEDTETGEKIGTLGIKSEAEQVAIVGNTYYDTLAGAIDAAGRNNQTVTVRKQIRNSDRIVIANGKDITIDLATFSIIMENDGVIEIEEGGKLTVIDSQANIATDTAYSGIINNNGTTIINNGTLVLGSDDGREYISPKIIGVGEAVSGTGTITLYDGAIINN